MSNQNGDASLKEQFKYLQEQQLRKKQRIKELHESKVNKEKSLVKERSFGADELNKIKHKSVAKEDGSFGVNDDLDLMLSDAVDGGTNESYISPELVDHLNNQIRELKDEAGRMRKLVGEREFEVKQLRKKSQEKCDVPTGITNENAASKIVELSKKLREMTAELEGERTKNKVLVKKCNDLETQNKVQQTYEREQTSQSIDSTKSPDKDELKLTQDKLKHAEMKLSELRNNNQLLKHDIKMAQKIISQEVGDGVTIQSVSSVPGSWRGRAEQIIALNNKIVDLKSQLEEYQMHDLDSALATSSLATSRSLRQPSSVDKQREQIRRLEKDRKDSQQKTQDELKVLEEEFTSQKQKLEAAKARNKVLAGEVKSLKQQMQTLIDKGQNDDELVSALMKQQSSLRDMLNESQKTQDAATSATSNKVLQLAAQKQQDDAIVEQLRAIIGEKESRLAQLERDIQQIQMSKLHEAQKEGLKAIFHLNNEEQDQQNDATENTQQNTTTQNQKPTKHAFEERTGSGMSCARGHETIADRLADGGGRKARSGSGRPPSSRTTSRITPSPTLHRANSLIEKKECAEIVQSKTLCQAAEVERDKLSELVKVLHSRLDEANQTLLDSQNQAINLKRKNALLEKKISKHNLLETQGRLNSSRQPPTAKSSEIDNETEELTTSLLIQQDENEALKAALSSAIKAKEADLQAYSEMMENTRAVFLQSLQHHGT